MGRPPIAGRGVRILCMDGGGLKVPPSCRGCLLVNSWAVLTSKALHVPSFAPSCCKRHPSRLSQASCSCCAVGCRSGAASGTAAVAVEPVRWQRGSWLRPCLLRGQGLATLRMLRQLQDRTGRQMHEVRLFVTIGKLCDVLLGYARCSDESRRESRVRMHNAA